MSNPNYRKKLIGVALPLEVINIASQKETNPFLKYHPRQRFISGGHVVLSQHVVRWYLHQ
jgi:hypothetical protein